jgi:carboxymethylenebutenolidase
MKTLPSLVIGVVIGVAAASLILRNVIGADVAPATTSTTASAPVASTAPAAVTASTAPKPAPVSSNVHPISKNITDRLTKSPRHFDIVPIKQGDRDVETYVFYPVTKDKAMAVVLIHEIYGLSDWMRAAGDQLAEAGYIVLVPDLLSGMGPHKGGTLDFPEAQVTTAIQTKLPAAQVLADVDAVVDYAKKLPGCNGNVAVGGFCWGGGKAFAVAAENKDIKAAFVFYGAPMLPVADVPKVNVPVYGFYGENDNRVSGGIPAEQTAMKAAGKTYDAVIYTGADHGFMRLGQMDNATPTNKKAAEDSWTRWLDILKKVNATDNTAKAADTTTKPAAPTDAKPAAGTNSKS